MQLSLWGLKIARGIFQAPRCGEELETSFTLPCSLFFASIPFLKKSVLVFKARKSHQPLFSCSTFFFRPPLFLGVRGRLGFRATVRQKFRNGWIWFPPLKWTPVNFDETKSFRTDGFGKFRSPFFKLLKSNGWAKGKSTCLNAVRRFVDSKVRELDLVGTRLNFELVPLVAIFGELTWLGPVKFIQTYKLVMDTF